MENGISQLIELFLPWLGFVSAILVFAKLLSWAKNRKTGALVFGILVQMFTPDPYAERTIKVVQEDKKQSVGESQTDDDGVGDLARKKTNKS